MASSSSKVTLDDVYETLKQLEDVEQFPVHSPVPGYAGNDARRLDWSLTSPPSRSGERQRSFDEPGHGSLADIREILADHLWIRHNTSVRSTTHVR